MLAEKILLLANNSRLREEMGIRNRQRYLSVYTPEEYGKGMVDAFERIEAMA